MEIEILSFKFRGRKRKATFLKDNDIICDRTYYTNGYGIPNNLSAVRWIKSKCIGDKVSEHPYRTYIRLSKDFGIKI